MYCIFVYGFLFHNDFSVYVRLVFVIFQVILYFFAISNKEIHIINKLFYMCLTMFLGFFILRLFPIWVW